MTDDLDALREEFHSLATDAEMEQLWTDAYRELWMEERSKNREELAARDHEAVEYLASKLGQRDRWIYQQRCNGKRNPQVIAKLENIFVGHGWEHIGTDQGIRDAVKRYCIKTGSSPLPSNRGGRPSKQNPKAKTPK